VIKVKKEHRKGKEIFIPREIQPNFDEKVYIFKLEDTFYLISESEWLDIFDRIEKRDQYSPKKKRQIKRMYSKRSRKVKIKEDGRILIPIKFRK